MKDCQFGVSPVNYSDSDSGYANGAYIKCSTKFLSGIALIHVSGDFFAGKRGQCVGTDRVC